MRGQAAVDVVIQAVTSGMRVHNVLDSSSAPTAYVYQSFEGASLTVLENGQIGLAFESDNGSTLVAEGILNETWAFAAPGEPVHTHYQVSGDSIIQIIDHQAADYTYSIVADPQWGWEGVLLWAHQNRLKAQDVAAGNLAPIICAQLFLIGAPVLAALWGHMRPQSTPKQIKLT